MFSGPDNIEDKNKTIIDDDRWLRPYTFEINNSFVRVIGRGEHRSVRFITEPFKSEPK